MSGLQTLSPEMEGSGHWFCADSQVHPEQESPNAPALETPTVNSDPAPTPTDEAMLRTSPRRQLLYHLPIRETLPAGSGEPRGELKPVDFFGRDFSNSQDGSKTILGPSTGSRSSNLSTAFLNLFLYPGPVCFPYGLSPQLWPEASQIQSMRSEEYWRCSSFH